MTIDDIPLSEINASLLAAKPDNEILRLLTDALLIQNNAMLKHFDDDKDSFGSINDTLAKIDKKLDIHILELQDNKATQDHVWIDVQDRFDTMQRSMDAMSKASQPVQEWFKNITFLKTAIMALVVLLGTIVGILVGVKTFFKA